MYGNASPAHLGSRMLPAAIIDRTYFRKCISYPALMHCSHAKMYQQGGHVYKTVKFSATAATQPRYVFEANFTAG